MGSADTWRLIRESLSAFRCSHRHGQCYFSEQFAETERAHTFTSQPGKPSQAKLSLLENQAFANLDSISAGPPEETADPMSAVKF